MIAIVFRIEAESIFNRYLIDLIGFASDVEANIRNVMKVLLQFVDVLAAMTRNRVPGPGRNPLRGWELSGVRSQLAAG